MDAAQAGLSHMTRALTGEKNHCDVSEWLDDNGKPVRVYWLPPTGVQQIKIDSFKTDVERAAMTVKVRALNEKGEPIFAKTPIESLLNDYDISVINSLSWLIVTNFGQDEPQDLTDKIEAQAKE